MDTKTPYFAAGLACVAALAMANAHAKNPGIDANAGKQRAAVCFACHNTNGMAQIPGVPNLAGQNSDYLEEALRAYRDGHTRQNVIMNAMASPLSDGDIANISAYFSLLHPQMK
ncbi:Cytochrome c4 [Paraburkholderia tropica]|uniref:c-type cytochrome n=1 Tax=Paraburkholderia tropica TaxID=92647 RepID=UPI001CB0E664|nr:cytochrome c [Paraburkholderia tropica]CAG9200663.1 Cytochrome c4 [Paraburkholderia tropica]